MPQTREQLLIVILFVIPGFLGQWVVDRFVVRPGKSEIETILTAITASCATWAVWYPIILMVRAWTNSPYVMSLLLFLALIVTPVVGALVMSATDWRWRTRLKESLRKRFGLQWLNPRPTAWDCVFSPGAKYWVRARLKDGTLVHGVYQQGSTAGSFMDKHDLFLSVAYDGADGKFGKRVKRTAGVYVPEGSFDLIEFFAESDPSIPSAEGDEHGRAEEAAAGATVAREAATDTRKSEAANSLQEDSGG